MAQVGFNLVTASAGILFAYRVFAMWNRHRVVYAVVGFFYFVMVGCWVRLPYFYREVLLMHIQIATSTQLKNVNGPAVAFGSNCVELPVHARWLSMSFISSLIFDGVILTATIVKLRGTMSPSSSLGFLIYRDALLYFVVTAVANLVLVIINLVPSAPLPLKGSVLPFTTVFTVSMGTRTFLNLRLFKRREDGSMMTPLTEQPRTFTIPTALEEASYEFYGNKVGGTRLQ